MSMGQIQPVSNIRWASDTKTQQQQQLDGGAAIALFSSSLAVGEASSSTAAAQDPGSLASLQGAFERGRRGSFVMEPFAELLRATTSGDVGQATMAQVNVSIGAVQAAIVSKMAKTATEGIKSLTQQS